MRHNMLPILLGCLLVACGVFLSGTVLEWTVFPIGTIVGTARRAVALGFLRGGLVAVGIYLLVRRPQITAVDLGAFLLCSAVVGVIAVMLLQVLYVPPAVFSGWKSFVPPAERNQLGFRGREIAYHSQDYVTLLLGDSQVESTSLTFDDMPERRLEIHLALPNTRVFSLGASGYGQDQELLALEEYLKKYRADLVVLWQTPANDVWNNVFNTHMGNRNPKPTFWLDDAGRLQGPGESLLQPLGNSPIVLVSLWQLAFGLPWRDRSWERRLPEAYIPVDRHNGAVRTEWQDRWNANVGGMRGESLVTEKSHFAVALTPRSKRMQYGLDLTRALTQRIQELVRAQQGRLVVFWAAAGDSPWEGDHMYLLNQKYYRISKQQFEANWNYVNSGFDAEFIPITVKEWRVGPEDAHLNSKATDQVMADLAKRLRPKMTNKDEARLRWQRD